MSAAVPFALPFSHYAKLGYVPTPTHGKAAFLLGWQKLQLTQEQCATFDADRDLNVGLVCSNIVGLDIDIDDEAHAREIEQLTRKVLSLPRTTPRRVGRWPRCLLIARVAQPVRSWNLMAKGHALFQLLGTGRQFVVHGIHPDTQQPYVLNQPLPLQAKLPLTTPEKLGTLAGVLVGALTRLGYDVGAGDPVRRHKASSGEWSDPSRPWTEGEMRLTREALAQLDPNMSHDEWIQVGFALHDGTHGSMEGWDLWDRWSSTATGISKNGKPKYLGEDYTYGRWLTFKAGIGTTKATLFKNDFPKLKPVLAEPVESVVDDTNEEFYISDTQLDAREHPINRQFVHDFLQIGATLLHGPGKKGKSWLLLDCAKHIACGQPFLGRMVEQARVLYVGAEDPERRLKDRQRVMGIVSTGELLFMDRPKFKRWAKHHAPRNPDGTRGAWTPRQLIELLIQQTQAQVIVLDTQEVVEVECGIVHGDKHDQLTRQHYISTSVYDELALEFGIAIVLVAHWGVIRNLSLAVTSPHEMINSTKTKLAGALTSITLGPLANQELDDDSGQMQLSVMGKDIVQGNGYFAVQRDPQTMRHSLLGPARDVQLRESLAEVLDALESTLAGRWGEWVTSSELAAKLDMRADTLRKKVRAIRTSAAKRGQLKLHWKGHEFVSSEAGYTLK